MRAAFRRRGSPLALDGAGLSSHRRRRSPMRIDRHVSALRAAAARASVHLTLDVLESRKGVETKPQKAVVGKRELEIRHWDGAALARGPRVPVDPREYC